MIKKTPNFNIILHFQENFGKWPVLRRFSDARFQSRKQRRLDPVQFQNLFFCVLVLEGLNLHTRLDVQLWRIFPPS